MNRIAFFSSNRQDRTLDVTQFSGTPDSTGTFIEFFTFNWLIRLCNIYTTVLRLNS